MTPLHVRPLRLRLEEYLRLVAATCLVLALISCVIFGQFVLLHYQGRETRGMVLQKRPHDHGGMLVVAFNADGRRYETRLVPGGDNPKFERVSIGDSVLLSYLPWSPRINFGGHKPTLRWDLLTIVIWGTLMVAVLGFFRFFVFADWFDRLEGKSSGWYDTDFSD